MSELTGGCACGAVRFEITAPLVGVGVCHCLAFCVSCGTPLWSIPGAQPPFFPVKVGALDDSSSLTPNLHLYTSSAQPWRLMHEGVPQFPKMPPMAPPVT